jgi:hypothetical protein
MRIIKALILLFGLFMATTLARADEHSGQVSVLGSGGSSCGSWTNRRRSNFENEAWLFGFLTAYNMYNMKRGTDITQNIDKQGLVSWVDNYCSSHPLDTIFDAATRLIEELNRRTAH